MTSILPIFTQKKQKRESNWCRHFTAFKISLILHIHPTLAKSILTTEQLETFLCFGRKNKTYINTRSFFGLKRILKTIIMQILQIKEYILDNHKPPKVIIFFTEQLNLRSN